MDAGPTWGNPLVSGARIYVEGGSSDSSALNVRCREAFNVLFQKCGFQGRMPRVIACGSRRQAYDDFCTALTQRSPGPIFLLVDSEDPVTDTKKPWRHLHGRDGWECPAGATDDQALLMTTCMETWIVADRDGLRKHYEHHQRCLRPASLPAAVNLEARDRHAIQDALVAATQDCTNAYAKNKRSFAALAGVDPATLRNLLPAFARMVRILDEKL